MVTIDFFESKFYLYLLKIVMDVTPQNRKAQNWTELSFNL